MTRSCGQATRSLLQYEVIFKNLKVTQKDVFAVRNDLFPVLSSGLVYRSRHQPKILGLIIGAYQEAILVMIEVIFVIPFTRQKNPESPRWDCPRPDTGTPGLTYETKRSSDTSSTWS